MGQDIKFLMEGVKEAVYEINTKSIDENVVYKEQEYTLLVTTYQSYHPYLRNKRYSK